MTAETTDANSSHRPPLNSAVVSRRGGFVPRLATPPPSLLPSVYSADPHELQAEASQGCPIFIAEVEGHMVSRLIDLNQASFPGNPLMPIF